MFPAQNVGAVVRRRRDDETYESIPRAESVGGTYNDLTITSYTFGVRARSAQPVCVACCIPRARACYVRASC